MPTPRSTRKPKPVSLSFFSGAMGMDLGLEAAGFETRLAVENDRYCRETIGLNRPDIPLLNDVNDCTRRSVLKAANLKAADPIDLVVGGPPCQAFSTAGKRQAFQDDRGNAFLSFVDLAIALKPKFVVIENVRGLLSCPLNHRPHDKRGAGFPELDQDELRGGALRFVLATIKKAGYGISFNLYNAANFGTPQVRERVIIIGAKDGTTPPFLLPTHAFGGEHGLKDWKTFRETTDGISKHDHLDFPKKRLKYYRMLRAGQNWRNLPVSIQKEAMGKSWYAGGGKTGFYRRLAWDKPAPTLVTHPAMPATDLAHPQELRPLSVQEYKRLQQFPDDWKFAGPLVQRYRQIGNAVPIGLGLAVGQLVKKLLVGKKPKQISDFKYSRYKNTSHKTWQCQ